MNILFIRNFGSDLGFTFFPQKRFFEAIVDFLNFAV